MALFSRARGFEQDQEGARMLEMVKRTRFLDPKLFTAFAAAAELENFTRAAQVARMTQSGVSQHVAKLEEQIGRQLFKRIGKKVVLTQAGKMLLHFLHSHVADLDSFFDRVQTEQTALSGTVSYAMPPSCLFSTHFQDLLEKRRQHPDLRLKVTVASSPEILDLVLQNTVDFGFLTVRPENPALMLQPYCDEEYVFVSANQLAMSTMRPEDVFAHAMIAYPGADVYYNAWIRHYLPHEKRDFHSLMRTGEINSLDGAITMVVGGLGSGIFPQHCVQAKIDAGALFRLQTKGPPLLNAVFMARLAEAVPPRRVSQVMEWFFEMVAQPPTARVARARRSRA